MSHPTHDTGQGHGTAGGHEKRDVTFRPIVIATLVGAAVLVFIFLMVRFTLSSMATHEAATSPRANPLAGSLGRSAPPEPRLQAHPVQDLVEMRRAEAETLATYGWVDQNNGVVRLPITRAMELLVQRGLPARMPAEPTR